MNTTHKDKAVRQIFISLVIQFLPNIFIQYLTNTGIIIWENLLLRNIVAVFLWLSLVYGYFLFVKACRLYIKSKGYSVVWGWFGLLSIFGLFVLSVMTPKNTIISSEDLAEEKFEYNPFYQINLLEICGLYLLNTYLVIFYLLYLVIFISQNDIDNLFQKIDSPIEYLISISIILIFASLFTRDLKLADFKIKDFVPTYKVSWRLLIKLTIIYSTFSISFGRIFYYYLSFRYPNYVNNIINYSLPLDFTNFIIQIFLRILITLIFAPVICLILQKTSLKWSYKKSIFFLSIIFSLIDFSPDSLIIFIEVVIVSILFLKTANIFYVILFQLFTKLILNFIYLISYSNKNSFSTISITEYQNIHQPFLILYTIMAIISVTFIIDFICKNFPKENDLIPYFRNKNKLLS